MAQQSNQLYLAVLPQISLSAGSVGEAREVLTLLASRDLATQFFPDQLNAYLTVFKRGQEALTGGHVQEYQCHPEETADGRIVVKVTQLVR